MLFQLEARNTLGQPLRGLFTLQVAVPVFHQPQIVILAVLELHEAVILAHILQKDHVLVELTQCVVERDALIEINGAVLVVVQDDERCLYLVGEAVRRVALVGILVVEEVALEAALRTLEDTLIRAAGVPIHRAVHAHHVGERRTGHGALEDVGLADQERGLVPAPRMPVQPHVGRVDDAGLYGRLDRRHHAPHGAHARIVDLVHDVGQEHGVTA